SANVILKDGAQNPSQAAEVPLPDLLRPTAPELSLAADGITLTITGESGTEAVVTVNGEAFKTVTLEGEPGTAEVTLPETNGGLVTVVLDDGTHTSQSSELPLRDLLAPDAPELSLAAD